MGSLIGHVYGFCVIDNCKNEGIINATGNDHIKVGGILGYVYGNSLITDCDNHGAISGSTSANDKYVYVGGIVGAVTSNTHTISRCQNYGNISGIAVGGIIGISTTQTYSTIDNCKNAGIVDFEQSGVYQGAGGIIGVLHDNARIVDCINIDSDSAIVGSLSSGECYITYCVTNSSKNIESIRYTDKVVIANTYRFNIECTENDLNSKDFYVLTLGWSEVIWDFSELDVENGKYPILKH